MRIARQCTRQQCRRRVGPSRGPRAGREKGNARERGYGRCRFSEMRQPRQAESAPKSPRTLPLGARSEPRRRRPKKRKLTQPRPAKPGTTRPGSCACCEAPRAVGWWTANSVLYLRGTRVSGNTNQLSELRMALVSDESAARDRGLVFRSSTGAEVCYLLVRTKQRAGSSARNSGGTLVEFFNVFSRPADT